MKYLVTVMVEEEFIMEVSAKDEESAAKKVYEAWEKISAIQINMEKLGKFEHVNENVEIEAEQID